jgi:hypothetical protein
MVAMIEKWDDVHPRGSSYRSGIRLLVRHLSRKFHFAFGGPKAAAIAAGKVAA